MSTFDPLLCVLGLALALSLTNATAVLPKRYLCVSGECQLQPPGTGNSGTLSYGQCVLSCEHGNLWPKPSTPPSIGRSLVTVSLNGIACISGNDALLQAACTNFANSLAFLVPGNSVPGSVGVRITFSIRDPTVTTASIDNDESYTASAVLRGSVLQIVIAAPTFFGARHALETVGQLVAYDDGTATLIMLSDFTIKDKPKFRYRGVMLDVARNYLSPDTIMQIIRTMGYNKMNVLHLHLTDSASFPVEIIDQPEMTMYGAYSSDKVYDAATIASLQAYANSFGVMILPEIDAPAHVSAGWNWGPQAGQGEFILCADPQGTGGTQWASDALEPPSGQLNIVNSNVYGVLGRVYDSVISAMGRSGYFHFGGDEVIVGSDKTWAACYNSSTLGTPIIEYIAAHGLDRSDESTFYQLWENFTTSATSQIAKSYEKIGVPGRKIHVWGASGGSAVTYNMINRPELTSVLPAEKFTIEVWDETAGSIAPSLIQKGYDIVLANYDYMYLDCGNAGWARPGGYWCQPYHEWYHIYDLIRDVQAAWGLSKHDLKQILGSETLAWAEMIDDSNVMQKLWPRSAALAEALWSHDVATSWYSADGRFHYWRDLMVRRGIPAEALQPLWCGQRQDNACTLSWGTPQGRRGTHPSSDDMSSKDINTRAQPGHASPKP